MRHALITVNALEDAALTDEEIENKITAIYRKFDVDQDMKLTKNEFVEGFMSDADLMRLLDT